MYLYETEQWSPGCVCGEGGKGWTDQQEQHCDKMMQVLPRLKHNAFLIRSTVACSGG